MSTAHYYFDMLPVRPKPQPFESLTGYLTRLSQINGINTVGQLTTLLFPNQSRRVICTLADYPLTSYSILLEQVSATGEFENNFSNLITRNTFYHLTRKFGRSVSPQATSRFLSDSLGTSLRYCPLYLVENGYYHLNWRFLAIRGCSQHKTHLLQNCGYCHQPIPFLSKLVIAPPVVVILAYAKPSLYPTANWKNSRLIRIT